MSQNLNNADLVIRNVRVFNSYFRNFNDANNCSAVQPLPNAPAVIGLLAVVRIVIFDLVEYGALADVDIVAAQNVQYTLYFPGSDPAALQQLGIRAVAVKIIQRSLPGQGFSACLQMPG